MMKSRILIVEDERIVAGDVKSRVESLGYEVVGTVATGEEAVSLAERERPDLVLMDIMLKGDINGIQAAEQIKTFYDIPVVYLTAYADEETLQRVKASEPFGYIVKPFEQRVLHTTIEIALYQSQMEKALKEKEELYRTLIETSPDAIVLTDLSGNLIMVNQRAASLYGQPGVNDLIGLNVFDIIATRDRKRAYDDARKTLKRERIDEVEYLLTRKDGSYFPGEVSASVVRDAKGRANGLIAVIRDISARKTSEIALKKSEERYRALTQEALVGVYIYSNKRRKYIFVNPAMEKITGYSREELLTMDPNQLALPEGKKLLAKREKAVKEGREKPSQYMIRILRKDGSIAVLEVRTRPIEDEGELAALGNCIDVTGIIKQKEQIERAKLEWERTFDATSDLVMIVDKDQGIMRANKAVADYAGLGFPELLKMTYFQLFHIDHHARPECPQLQCIKTGQPQIAEVQDNQTGKVFHVSISPLPEKGGEVTATVNVAHDITDLRSIEAALTESEAKFRGIAENAMDMIMSLDFDGNVLYVNPAVKQILGSSPEEYAGVNLLESGSGLPLTNMLNNEKMAEIMEKEQPPLFEVEIAARNGRKRTLEVAAQKLSNIIVAIARDVTDRKIMLQQLMRASKLASVGVLAAGIAHQINNPLAIMLSASTVLRDLLTNDSGDGVPSELQDDVYKYLDMMEEQVDRTRRVVSGLLSFTQARQSKIRLTNLDEIINDALELLNASLSSKKIKVELGMKPDLPEVMVDPAAFQQVVVNIIQNALEAMGDDGKLVIRSEAGNNVVRVYVSDTGPGVSKELREEIFEPLFTTKESRKGTGLGLSVSVMLLERFSGRIVVEDTPGGGATFIIEIPLPEETRDAG